MGGYHGEVLLGLRTDGPSHPSSFLALDPLRTFYNPHISFEFLMPNEFAVAVRFLAFLG